MRDTTEPEAELGGTLYSPAVRSPARVALALPRELSTSRIPLVLLAFQKWKRGIHDRNLFSRSA